MGIDTEMYFYKYDEFSRFPYSKSLEFNSYLLVFMWMAKNKEMYFYKGGTKVIEKCYGSLRFTGKFFEHIWMFSKSSTFYNEDFEILALYHRGQICITQGSSSRSKRERVVPKNGRTWCKK
jgi:hypothetical protein